MGQQASIFLFPQHWKEDEPSAFADIKYDPQFGFEARRKQRVIKATKEEMDSANLDHTVRDFCAHIRIDYRGCLRYNMPFTHKCNELEHELHECHMSELVHDMKEFEREKRLNARERRLREKAQ